VYDKPSDIVVSATYYVYISLVSDFLKSFQQASVFRYNFLNRHIRHVKPITVAMWDIVYDDISQKHETPTYLA